MKLSENARQRYRNSVDFNNFKFKNGNMKKYLIQCPYCSCLEKSTVPLNELGIFTLFENEFIYQRCQRCKDKNKPAQDHELETTI